MNKWKYRPLTRRLIRFLSVFILITLSFGVEVVLPGVSLPFGFEVSLAEGSDQLMTVVLPPRVVPADGEEGVPVNLLEISATFNEPVTFGEFTVKFDTGNEVQGTRSGNGTPRVTFTREGPLLLYNTVHRVSLLELADLNGNPIINEDCDGDGTAHDFCWTFKTEKPLVSFSPSIVEVPEGNGPVVLTATLSDETHQMVTVNYTTVSGSATAPADYETSSGTITFAPGEISQDLPPINITNDSVWELAQSFEVILSNPPNSNADLGTEVATVVINDDDPRPIVSFEPASYKRMEDEGSVTLTVTLGGESEEPISVMYETVDDSAIAPTDYEASAGEIIFEPGDVSKPLVINLTNDELREGTENFFVVLTNSDHAELGTAEAMVTITDDDPLPTVSFTPADYSVGEADGSVQVIVALSNPTVDEVTIMLETVAGTATASSDYVALTETPLTFAPGEVSQSFSVTIIDNPFVEDTETFQVVLTGAANAVLGVDQATITIIDDDEFPTVSFEQTDYTVSESAGSVVLTVNLSGESDQDMVVTYQAVDGSAIHPADYTPANGTVTIAPGILSENFSINIVNDGFVEGNETFQVVLTGAERGIVGSPDTATVTIADDDAFPLLISTSPISGAVGVPVNLAQISATFSKPVMVEEFNVKYEIGNEVFGERSGDGTPTLAFAPAEPLLYETVYTVFLLNIVDLSNNPFAGDDCDGDGIFHDFCWTFTTEERPLPVISFNPTSYEVGEGAGSVTVRAELSLTSTEAVTATYDTLDGSAVAGIDYVPNSGAIIFDPGQTNQGISIEIINDEVEEETETFQVVLTSIQGATSGITEATVSILNDDEPGVPPTCSFTPSDTVIEPGGNVQFVNASAGTEPLTYLWDFGDGSTSAEASPSHTFAELGIYQVMLTVTNPFGSASCEVDVRVIVPSDFIFNQSVIFWPPASTHPEVADFSVSGTLELTPDFNDAVLDELLTLHIEIGGQLAEDTVQLTHQGNRYFFHESSGPDVSGLEVRDVVIHWFAEGIAGFSADGQFRLDGVDENTRPTNVTYGFSGQVLFNGKLEGLEGSTIIPHIHEAQVHQWIFGQ
jgi:PKD repeat protein